MFYFPLSYIMVLILLIHIQHSQFADNIDEIQEQTEKEPENMGVAETVGIHENYRPKHKYKFGANHQDLSKRSSETNTEVQEDNLMQCAVMFKNNEPVGILQPYEDSYRFLPVSGEPTFVELNPVPVQKKSIVDVINPSAVDTEMNQDKSDEKVAFFDDRYPSILAKFKIDSRVASNRRQLLKRATESPNVINSQLSSLKSTLARVKSEDNIGVEEELKNILDDMGLIEDYPNREEKREIAETANEVAEDENLEIGTNKINLLKENQKDGRDKRESESQVTKRESTSGREVSGKVRISEASMGTTVRVSRGTPKENACPDKTTSVDEEDVRKKRDYIYNDFGVSKSDVMVVDSSSTLISETDDLNTYEKRVEREIRDKIQKLKEDVKKEIEDLSKARKLKLTEDLIRKKRHILPTLLDEESKDIDPTLNDNENNSEHIRKKRDLNSNEENLRVVNNKVALRNAETKSDNNSDQEIRMPYMKKKYYSGIIRQKRHAEDDELYAQDDVEEIGKNRFPKGTTPNKMSKDNNENMAIQNVKDFNSNNLDQSGFIFEPILLEKRSCSGCKNSNCHCDKNGNCKCGGHVSNENNVLYQNSDQEKSLFHKRNSEMEFNIPAANSEAERIDDKYYDTPETEVDQVDSATEEIRHTNVREPRKSKDKFHFTDGEYFIYQHPDVYKLTPVDNSREYENMISSHKERQASNHLFAIKENTMPHSRFRRRTQTDNNAPIQLIDLSAEDLFGALPQSFEGELARYKRVKRARVRK